MATEIESVQLVAFVSGPAVASAAALWTECLPESPFENFITLAPGHTSASGMVGEVRVEIQSQAQRIDLFLFGPSLPGVPQQLPPPLPSLAKALAFGKPLFGRLRRNRAVTRLAALVGARDIVRDDEEANAKLVERTGLVLKEGSKETTFATNVPVDSVAQPGVKLNRLCRWNTGLLYLIQLSPGQGMQVHQPVGSNARHLLQTVVDVNTHVDTPPAQRKEEAIVKELLDHAAAILESGYSALSR